MPRTRENFDLYKGDTRQISIVMPPGTPSLAGATAKWRLGTSSSAAAPDTKLTKQTSNSTLTIQQVNGISSLVFTILKTDLDAISEGTYYHEAEITEATGKTHTITTGQVRVIATMQP